MAINTFWIKNWSFELNWIEKLIFFLIEIVRGLPLVRNKMIAYLKTKYAFFD